jgi:putative ribosome biogenesis GTPase RsgA
VTNLNNALALVVVVSKSPKNDLNIIFRYFFRFRINRISTYIGLKKIMKEI